MDVIACEIQRSQTDTMRLIVFTEKTVRSISRMYLYRTQTQPSAVALLCGIQTLLVLVANLHEI